MLRKITKEAGRYKTIGELHDYGRGIWNDIAKSLLKAEGKKTFTDADVQKKLDSFSEPVNYNAAEQSMLRGKVKTRTRLGSTARTAH